MANLIRLKRASGSDPAASDLVSGEPAVRTDTGELFFKKDDGSVAKVSGAGGGPDFKYLALRNAANNGAASYPNADFTLVTSGTTTALTPTAANTLLVSVNGVIQKPNTGTSTPSSGFALSGSTIKFGANISAAPDFILYQESGGIGEPSDETVGEDKLKVSNNPVNGYFLSAQSGNTGGLTWAAPVATSCTGNSATATALATARAINGVNFDGTAAITVTAAAGTLSGNTLNSSVVTSSLTSLGDLTSLTVTGDLVVDTSTLKVDSSNNRVGIGTTSPSSIFHVRPLDETNFLVRNEGSTLVLASETNSGRDNNRGMALEATAFEFIEGGSEKMRIDSSGRVLIGTTLTPSSSKCSLEVAYLGSTSSGNVIELTQQTNGTDKAAAALGLAIGNGGQSTNAADLFFATAISGSLNTRMTIKDSGNVGIGTTSPSANLESEGNVSSTTQFSGFQGLRIQNANGSTHGLTADINMVVGTGTNNRGAVIGVEYSSAASGNDLYFATNPNAVTNSDAVAERMRITSAGKVGIGTTSPSTTLHLDSASTPTTIQIDSDTESSIDFNDHGGSAKRYKIGTNISSNDGQFEIKDMTANAERMRIHSSGELSVGTTSKNLQGGGASDFFLSIQANTGSNHNGICVGGVASGHAAVTTRPSGTHLYFAGFFLNGSASGVGNIEVGNSGVSFHTTSDYRLKENVTDISDGITRLKELLPKRFNFINDETNTLQDGFLAHEVSSIVPEAISGEKDAVATEDSGMQKKGDPIYQQIDQSKLVPLLTAALQEAIVRIEALEAK